MIGERSTVEIKDQKTGKTKTYTGFALLTAASSGEVIINFSSKEVAIRLITLNTNQVSKHG